MSHNFQGVHSFGNFCLTHLHDKYLIFPLLLYARPIPSPSNRPIVAWNLGGITFIMDSLTTHPSNAQQAKARCRREPDSESGPVQGGAQGPVGVGAFCHERRCGPQ